MAALSQLLVSIRASASEWSSDIKSIQRDASALDRTLRPIQQTFENFGKPLAAAGLGIGASLFALTKIGADFGDQMDEFSEKTGISAVELSKLKHVADQSNSSFDSVATGLKFLSKNLAEAGSGSKEQAKLFESLGVQTKDASGNIRPLNDVLLDVSDKFNQLPDGAEKSALALILFGKQGTDMIPLLNRGSAGIQELGNEAERLGIVVDAAAAKLGDQFNKSLTRVKEASLGLAVTVSEQLLPSMTKLVDKGVESVVWVKDLAVQFPLAAKGAAALGVAATLAGGGLLSISTAAIVIPKLLGGLATFAEATGISAFLGTLVSTESAVFSLFGVLETVIGVLSGVAEVAAIAAGALAAIYVVKKASDWLGLSDAIVEAGRSLFDAAKSAGRFASDMAGIAWSSIKQGAKDAGNAVLDFVGSFGLLNSQEVKSIWQEFKDDLQRDVISPFVAAKKAADELNAAMSRFTDNGPPPSLPPSSPTGSALDSIVAEMKMKAGRAHQLTEEELKLRAAIDKLKEGITPSVAEQQALNSALVELQAEGKPAAAILEGLGKQAKEMAHSLSLAGDAIPGAVRLTALKEITKELNALHSGDLAQSMADFSKKDLSFSMVDAAVRMQQAWEDANGKAFDSSNEFFNKLNGLRDTDLDDQVEFNEKWEKAVKLRNEKVAADYKQSIDDVKRSAGAIFDDMFVKGQSVFSSLASLLKSGPLSIGRAIFEDVTGTLFGPLLDAFRNFFNTTIKGVIDGALGGIGKSIGGALGGLFGGGGAIAAGKLGGTTMLGTAPIGGSAGLFGLSGAATLGIGAAVAGAVALATHYIGKGRRAENAFTSGSQGQFDKDLGSVFNQFQSQRDKGSLTLDSAQSLQKQLEDLLHGITDDANAFAAKGKTEKKVIDNFFAQQEQLFGKDWTNLTSQIDSSIATLKAQAPASIAATASAAIAGIPDTGRAGSASTIFASAVDVFKGVIDKFTGSSAVPANQTIQMTISNSPEITITGDLSGGGDLVQEFTRALSLNSDSLAEKIARSVKSYLPGVVAAGGAA